MKHTYIFSFVILISLSVIFTCKENKTIKINQIFSEYNKPDVPGAAVGIIKDGKFIFKKGYGLANLETGRKANEYTNYRLASVSKQFTTMCIMILKEKGKISYDDRLTDVFTDFPKYGDKITIRNLLQHTSGLIDYESLIPDDQTEQVKDKDVLEMMKTQDSTYFEPGTKFKYSNSGYVLLAMIVEKISGKRFAKFLDENIFSPLYMYNTVPYEKGISTVTNRAFGYTKTDTGFVKSDQSVTSAVLGDGGIYTSLVDYFKWDQALYSDVLVTQKTLEEAFTPGKLKDGTKIETGYGFGWFTETADGKKWVGHSGHTCGFSTYVLRIPKHKFTTVILINQRDIDTEKIAHKVTNLYFDGMFNIE